ncbi:MAG TPA: cytochrome c biogenesis CcdA family protein, partial [Pseudohaliea sp.]|nr:cytochrome c biogenesis CcdA family protein [Pseudohaliea sp.]
MIEIGYLAAFLGGVLTLLSPCGALLLPSFFAYAFDRPGVLLARTGVFYAGLAAVMVPLGTGAAFASQVLLSNQERLIVAAGWLLVVLGVLTAAGAGRLLPSLGGRVQGRVAGRTSPAAVFGLGAVYGVAGSCAGPILGAVLTIAALDGRPAHGAALLAVYALGMAAPLFLLAGAWQRFELGQRGWLRGRAVQLGRFELHTTSLVTGVLFVAIGAWLLVSGGSMALPGLPDTTQLDLTAQGWLLRLDRLAPDRLVLTVIAVIAALVLLWRGWSARRRRAVVTSASGTPRRTRPGR